MSGSGHQRALSRASSATWDGAPRRAPDIIDLDRYMRGGQPRGRRRREDCERLVVDGGGLSGGGSAETTPAKPSSSTTSALRDKRYSHDSGLSDGSYVRRRTHRRVVGDTSGMRAYREREREREATRAASATSMRSFRAACTRALKEQQEQIARVAQLCEKLTRTGAGGGGPGAGGRKPSATATQESSDISSSSQSTRNRRKDKHRTDECKTYKIIMTKLDELNRLFAARARSPPPAARRARSPHTPSADSVSVSDKFVATETPPRSHTLSRIANRRQNTRVAYTLISENRVSTGTPQHSVRRAPTPQLVERGAGGGSARAPPRLAAARALAVDIAPQPPRPAHSPRTPAPRRSGLLNVATNSAMQCESIDGSLLSRAPPICQFDLDDPLHIYAQVKRMQQLNTSSARRRTRSADNSRKTGNTTRQSTYDGDKHHMHHHGTSLCSLCRGYWRALTTLATQLFGRQESEYQA